MHKWYKIVEFLQNLNLFFNLPNLIPPFASYDIAKELMNPLKLFRINFKL